MSFEYPDGDAAFVSMIWIAFAAFGIYFAAQGHMPWYIAFCIGTGPVAILVWFQLRIAGYTLAFINAAWCLSAIAAIFALDQFELRSLWRVVGSGYMAMTMFNWARQKSVEK